MAARSARSISSSPAGQGVLVRVDLNVPDGGRQGHRRHPHRAHGADDPEIADKGGKVILLAHFGRPKSGPRRSQFA